MSNRIEADEAKAKSNRHREATVTAPVLDSTRHITTNRAGTPVLGLVVKWPVIASNI